MEISVCFSWALDPQLFNISFSLFAVILFMTHLFMTQTHLLWQEKPRENVIRLWLLFDDDVVVMQ